MVCTLVSSGSPMCSRIKDPGKEPTFSHSTLKIHCFHQQNPRVKNNIHKYWKRPKHHLINPVILGSEEVPSHKANKKGVFEKKNGFIEKGCQQLLVLCGFGYWVNGFRCFPWLGLNFHMAYNLSMHPSTLQLVQNSGSLPMVAKPLYGILSDTLSIAGAHRIPYISIGVLLQVISWWSLALIPLASEALPVLMACVVIGNLGASIAEVAKDALIAEYGQKNKFPGVQSYALMASAAGGLLGNFLGGFFLQKTQHTKYMFLAFAALLVLQLAVNFATREESLDLPRNLNDSLVKKSILESIRKQYSDLMVVVQEDSISRPLKWIVASIVTVPILSGSIFCYQMQCLNLDPSVIGMSKVTGQLMLLFTTVFYDKFWKDIPMRKLIGTVQILYSFSLLLDLILVKQVNLRLGIPNEAFAFCFSGLAEIIAQFKLLPFHVLLASLAPPGSEGSLMSLLASALCLSSIVSGFLGVGLASLLGITSGDYSSLPLGIMMQFFASLLPMLWIDLVPVTQASAEKLREKGISKRTRKNRRVGRVAFDSTSPFEREREPDLQI